MKAAANQNPTLDAVYEQLLSKPLLDYVTAS
jgi:hypothetical protein